MRAVREDRVWRLAVWGTTRGLGGIRDFLDAQRAYEVGMVNKVVGKGEELQLRVGSQRAGACGW